MTDRDEYAPRRARGTEVREDMFKCFAGARSLYG